MRLNKKIAISESGFIFDSQTGDSYTLNPLGMEILDMMKKGMNENNIKSALLEKYDVELTVLEKSYDEFISVLKNLNIIINE